MPDLELDPLTGQAKGNPMAGVEGGAGSAGAEAGAGSAGAADASSAGEGGGQGGQAATDHEARIRDLQAQNDRLRTEQETLRHQMEELHAKQTRLGQGGQAITAEQIEQARREFDELYETDRYGTLATMIGAEVEHRLTTHSRRVQEANAKARTLIADTLQRRPELREIRNEVTAIIRRFPHLAMEPDGLDLAIDAVRSRNLSAIQATESARQAEDARKQAAQTHPAGATPNPGQRGTGTQELDDFDRALAAGGRRPDFMR